MAGGAAGGFVSRAFESMLKECNSRKYNALQSAIQAYLDSGNGVNQQADIGEAKQVLSATSNQSDSSESDSRAETNVVVSDHSAGDAANEAIPTIRTTNGSESIATILATAGHALGEAEAELVLNPLRLAFETKNIKLVELALDCLHKLIEYNHLEGDPGLEGGKNSKLLKDILKMVCSSADNSAPDSTTLQVLKVLLTAIASTNMRVHGKPMLEIIRVCFNIALNSKNPINQATSKAMLTQMLSIIFRAVETDVVSSSPQPKEAPLENGSNSVVEVTNRYSSSKIKTSSNLRFVKLGSSTSLVTSEGTKSLLGGNDIKGLEAILEKAMDFEDGGEVAGGTDPESMSIEQRDALLVLHTLCKMATTSGNNDLTTRTRILSLDLLQSALEDVGPLFTKNVQFIHSMRAHLSYALLKASISHSPVLFQHATGLLSVILLRFRASFKAEIGVFFPMIVLKTLDGSDLNQRQNVLRMLEKVCKNPQMLVDLYVNYDCDPEAPNLFDRMVATLSKIAQGTQHVDPKSSTAFQMVSTKTMSLQSLVNVLKALSIWEKSKRLSGKQNNSKGYSKEISNGEELKHKGDLPDGPYELKSTEITIEDIISKFNKQPEMAIQHLISSQLVENTPASVAQFLRNTPNLDKAMVGQYLGKKEEFPIAVMNAYVESMSSSGMRLDIAIQEFLKGFELPGEALEIDHIMEKFSERYCADNPGLFKNANTAYVLAYAVIMLNTDVHNPMGPLKISKSDFFSMNAINDGEESAPQELLEEIYDSIVKEGMKLKEEPAGSLENGKQKPVVEVEGHLLDILNLSFAQRSSSTEPKSVSDGTVKEIQALIKEHGGNRGVFFTSNNIELVCPLVEAVGWPLLATFSVNMGEVDNMQRISICMEGFKEAICVTHALGMDTLRYAFLTSLLRYNSLHAPKEMRSKNIEALRTLLALCDTDMNALKDSWFAIQECISRLEYMVTWPAMTATVMQGGSQISRDAIIQSLRELSGKSTDQVFLNSAKLPSEAAVEFFSALCSVSAEELKQNPVRVYSLLKVVEVSHYNMARIRMVWARIWSVLSRHLTVAGSHVDEKVAIYSIDSLRQIGMKYLEHEELPYFSFQNDILKPFVVLMQHSRNESLRKLILDCIVQVIKSKVSTLKSGWHSVFMVFAAAADDDHEPIVERAFENVEQGILEHFDLFIGNCFMDCVNCLMAFSNNKNFHGISLKAIALIRICSHRLAEVLTQGDFLKHIDAKASETCDVTEHYWLPMLAGLSDLTSDPRSEVRNCALEVLFDLLSERGSKFSPSFWENAFQRVLFPIFDHVRHAGKDSFISSGEGWHRESCIHALRLLCNLFSTFYKDVSFMLSPLLGLLLDCAKKTDQSVVSISLDALVHLIEVGGHQFNDENWDTLLQSIRDASYTSQPLELLNDLDFEMKHHGILSGDVDVTPLKTNVDGNVQYDNHETEDLAESEVSEDMPSPPAGRDVRRTEGNSLQRSQTLGQKIMENMKDNLFTRSFTSKPKIPDVTVPAYPSKTADTTKDIDTRDEEESPMLRTVRSKCMTQLLLLCVLDGIQKKYWDELNTRNRITMMEILLSVLEFAASYNSYKNLRLRMHQIPPERPPLNLLRQELSGTCIYLDILIKTTAAVNGQNEEAKREDKIEGIAEEKLISFCEKVLMEASDFQSSMEETTDMDIHRVLELRSPITVKVLKGMCQMNSKVFRDHLREFYPPITKLVCSEQMDIRGALADLFSIQLSRLLA